MESYLWLLAGGVAIVLQIAVVNVANLFLARVLARQRQYTIQAALGASRWVLAKSLLAESLFLSLAGSILGAAIAAVAVQAFKNLLPDSLPFWIQIDLNPAMLGFGTLTALLTGAAMGFAPAWIGSRVNLDGALRENSRASTGTARLRSAFVIAEVALSVLLLVGAGLLLKTFLNLQQADHGFIAENLVVARVSSSRFSTGSRPDRARQLAAYHSDIREKLARIPGVSAIALSNGLPYSGSETRRGRLRIQGRSDDELRFLLPVSGADVQWDFFSTMKIPLLNGRYFERSDTPDAPPVVIINETGAKALFPGQDPVGRMIQWGDTVSASNPYCRIVGVVKDVRWEAAERDTIELYYPFTQWPVANGFHLFRTDLTTA